VASLHVHDVKELLDVKLKTLKQIMEEPSLYRSAPAGVIDQLAGLRHVPVVSCKNYSAEVKALCAEKGVHLLESDGSGSGYRCTLHAAPAANGAAAAVVADGAAADGAAATTTQ
jgi:hypothetical protein